MSAKSRLLIVDDELSVRDSLGKWFGEEGYEVETAESASDAMTKLVEGKWHAALVDIKMHGTDGIELQRRMHEIDPDLVVIMMTGYASVDAGYHHSVGVRTDGTLAAWGDGTFGQLGDGRTFPSPPSQVP